MHTFSKAAIIFVILVLITLSCRIVQAQAFTVDTDVTFDGGLNRYEFGLNYVASGAGQTLQSELWQWSFFLEPTAPIPMDVLSPTGWQYTYNTDTGEFNWFTEGADGAANADFGPFVLHVGNTLTGFKLATVLGPDLSLAFATDTQTNTDLNFAVLPVTLPMLDVPEPGVVGFLLCAAIATCTNLVRRRR